MAHPEATVEIHGRATAVVATRLTGVDRQSAWSEACRVYPAYETYARRVPSRPFDLFRLAMR